MYRISTNLSNIDSQFHLRRREFYLNQIQNNLSSGERIQDLRDDPVGAAESVRLQSFLHRLNKFKDNTDYALHSLRYSEGKLQESIQLLQRIRELAVQGAHGIYSSENHSAMAFEINELLDEFSRVVNAKSGEGNTLFGGTNFETDSFRFEYGRVAGSLEDQIVNVSYQGNIRSRKIEIAENTFVDIDISGNQAFWAQNQRIFSQIDARDYQVSADTTITIDTTPINLTIGDTIAAIAHKINTSPAAVRATIDPVRNSLVLSTTEPHQMWLQESGTVLQDLGILAAGVPPNNIAPSAEVFGASVFENIIALRDALYESDIERIGGQLLQGVDDSLNAILTTVAKIGARDTRLQFNGDYLDYDIPELTGRIAQLTDVDFTDAILQLRIQETSHRAALATAARIVPQTLLDFLR